MGLAGRKQKQRIPADPRNLSWADDASRFGLSYLSKFGWDASQGLGTSGDGMKTHIKVQQKLDMMGIGAQHQRDPNGIAWKQNKDFEALLKRLNESTEEGGGADGEDAERKETEMDGSFVHAQENKAEEEEYVTTKKRRHKDGDAGETMKKKRKKEKEKCEKHSPDETPDPASEPPSAPSPSQPPSELTPKPRPMAHRARIRAAKRIADKSSSAISEILGIAPSSSAPTPTPTPPPTPPSSCTPGPRSSLTLDNLTTSTKSVADYFKEKLSARSSTSTSLAPSSAPSGSATPGLGSTGLRHSYAIVSPPHDDEAPPRGIGSRVPAVPTPLYAPESGITPDASARDAKGDVQDDGLTEKQRRKAERRAEKRKRREAEASQASPDREGDTNAGVDGQDASTEKRRRKAVCKTEKRKWREAEAEATQGQEKKREVLAGQPNSDVDAVADKERDRSLADGSEPRHEKQSKKERKKKPL